MVRRPPSSAALQSLVVARQHNGAPLQQFLSERLSLSRRAAKAMLDGRSVWVNRRCVWITHHQLHTGDTVEFPKAVADAARRQPGSAREAQAYSPERTHVRVLVETPDYIVADKPAGIVSCDDPKSVESILRTQLSEPNLQAVHRLDRDTTGCLLFAKSFAAFTAAVEMFKTHRVKKTYHAICVGQFKQAHFTVDSPLDGQPAVSRISRESASPDASFLRISIETGRTNQIRRHLASIRYPIVGDRVFGLKTARDPRLATLPRQMLHASSLSLPDPVRAHEEIKAHSPLPADFRRALKMFGMGK